MRGVGEHFVRRLSPAQLESVADAFEPLADQLPMQVKSTA